MMSSKKREKIFQNKQKKKEIFNLTLIVLWVKSKSFVYLSSPLLPQHESPLKSNNKKYSCLLIHLLSEEGRRS